MLNQTKEDSDEEILFHLDDSKSFSNYKSAMTTTLFDDSSHPLATPTDTDPLLSPPPPPPIQTPNIDDDNSYFNLPSADTNNSQQQRHKHHEPEPETQYTNISVSSTNKLVDSSINYKSTISDPLLAPQLPTTQNPNNAPDIINLQQHFEYENQNYSPREEVNQRYYMNITVSNPQKQESSSSSSLVPGGNTYITYLITTKTNFPEFARQQVAVRRRFKDVVTLSDRLAESYRGYFIPLRPDKSVVESQVMQKQEFVELRRSAVEKYLRRLSEHPVIRKSDELRVFLEAEGRLPLIPSDGVTSRVIDGATKLSRHYLLGGDSVGGRVQPQDVVQPAKSRWDFLRIIKEMNQAVSKPLDEEDAEFLQSKERLIHLEKQLTNASKQAELFVKAQQDMSDTMGEFGLSFIKLTKFENQQAILDTQRKRAADMKNLATAAIKASRYYRELNSRTVKHLDTLHDHMGFLLGAHTAFSDRSSALLTVQTLTSELDSLSSQAEKLQAASSKSFGNDTSKMVKLGELRETIRVTEDAKSCATKEYERIKENNRTEIERLDRERKADFKNMLKGFVLSQVAFSENIGKEWANVVEETSGYTKHDG